MGGSCSLGREFNGDLEAEFLEPTQVVAGEALGLLVVEVRGTQIMVGGAMPKDMPHRCEHAVGHRDRGLLGAAATQDAAEQRGQVGVAAAARTPRRLDEGTTEPAIALAGLAALAFAGALPVSGAEARPRRQVG